jgi:hypothetical protein
LGTKQGLELWTEKEGRTISNLVEHIVLAALATVQSKENT